LFDWVSGTAMIPYIEKLQGETRERFINEYRKRLQTGFESSPVFYPFKRIILEATF
jgi:trans-aconitate 2-methyltransferase